VRARVVSNLLIPFVVSALGFLSATRDRVAEVDHSAELE
jgi:hypothetical protein